MTFIASAAHESIKFSKLNSHFPTSQIPLFTLAVVGIKICLYMCVYVYTTYK